MSEWTWFVRTVLCLGVLAGQATQAKVLGNPVSYYPSDFYQEVENGLRGDDLKDRLFQILSQGHVPHEGSHDTTQPSCDKNLQTNKNNRCYSSIVLGYNRARKIMFGQIHLVNTDKGYGILDVYCQQMKTQEDFYGTPSPAPGVIPHVSVMNTEHTWPQSRFNSSFPAEMQKSDLHILFPVMTSANTSRGNLRFGDVVTVLSQPCPLSKRGYAANGSSEVFFEPPVAHKGNAARAELYFSVRYGMRIPPQEEASLRTWSKLDPVDEEERQRNEEVFKVQNNRNPFVDHPELVDLISDF